MRLENILQAHGNNLVHGIHDHSSSDRVCVVPQGLETMGKVAVMLVKLGTPEQHHSGIPEHQKFLIC